MNLFDWAGERGSREYLHRVAACRSVSDGLSRLAASHMEDSRSLVGSLHCYSAVGEGYCCLVQVWVRLGVDRGVGCGQVMPVQTGVVFALRVVEAEELVGIHGYSTADLDEWANMEDKDLSVLATAPHRALTQPWLQGSVLSPSSLVRQPCGTGSLLGCGLCHSSAISPLSVQGYPSFAHDSERELT